MKLEFPKDFLWGSSTTTHQTEGLGTTKRGEYVWDVFYRAYPDFFYQRVGPDKTSDFMNHYKEDIKMMAEKAGHNAFRYGFSWARLFPDGVNADPEAVKYYHDVLAEMKKNKMTRLMALMHFDMPMHAQRTGGLLDGEFPNRFAAYADFVFGEYGKEVDYFFTFCEPLVPVEAGYAGESHWPRIVNAKLAVQAAYHTILAHAKAVAVFNEKHRKNCAAKIAANVNINPAIPKDGKDYSPEDKKAADLHNALINFSFADAMTLGTFDPLLISYLKEKSLLPETRPSDLKLIAGVKVDFLAVNYYNPVRVQAPDKGETDPILSIAKRYVWPKARMNVFRGWEILPEGLETLADIIKVRYKNIPFIVAENGMGVQNEENYIDANGVVQDDYRIAFVSEHLHALHRAIARGANCFGYLMWTAVDNWSMGNAYKNRYGFIRVDLPTMKRTPKKSAGWFAQVQRQNGLEDDYKKIEEVIDLAKVKTEKSIGGM